MYQEALLVEEWFTDRNEMMELKTGFDENDNVKIININIWFYFI